LSYLDSATRARLDRLRESDSIGLYASDDPSDGNDPDNALTITIDPTLRVSAVNIHAIDKVRQPSALAKACKAAYAAALAARLPRMEPGGGGRAAPRPVANGGPIAFVTRPGDLLHRHRTRRESRLDASPAFGSREATGVSSNGCVAVDLPPANSFGSVTAEPGWLLNATASNLAKAVLEAFTDAYTKRDLR
jgi:hypothetical protein